MHIKDEEDIDDISLHLKKARSNFKSRDTNTDKLLTLISNSSVKRPLLSSSKKSVDSLATMISIQKQNMLHQQQPHLHNKCDNETYGDMDAEENEQNDVEQREDSVVGFCDVSTLSSSSRSPVVNEPISFACSSSSSNAVFGITYYSIIICQLNMEIQKKNFINFRNTGCHRTGQTPTKLAQHRSCSDSSFNCSSLIEWESESEWIVS